jgi:serine/threonine-protein kinase
MAIGKKPELSQLAVLDLRTRARRVLLREGSHAQYVAPGYLVYAAGSELRAVRFDPVRLEVIGTPVPVVESVMMPGFGNVGAAISANGTLIYRSARAGNQRALVWVDRNGREEPVGAPPGSFAIARLSPDGTRIVFNPGTDIWVWDLRRQAPTRLTFSESETYPVWTPDGRRLIWASGRAGPLNVYMQAADGTGKAERLTENPNFQRPMSMTPDGKQVVLWEDQPGRGNAALTILDLETRTQSPLVVSPAAVGNGEISPDGRWLAYDSSETGQTEVFASRFPDVGSGKRQVSRNGGRTPRWAHNGSELFYRELDGSITGVRVDTSAGQFVTSSPAKLVPGGRYVMSASWRQFDVTPDGRRFLMSKDAGESADGERGFIVVEHWVEELKRRLPLR